MLPRLPHRLRTLLPPIAISIMLGLTVHMAFWEQDPDCPAVRRIRGMDLVSYWVGGEILADERGAHLYEPKENEPRFKALYPKRPPHYPIGYPPPIYQLFSLPQRFSYFPVIKAVLFTVGALQLLGAKWCVDAVAGLKPYRKELLFLALLLPGGLSVVLTGQLGGLWTACLGAAMLLRSRGHAGLGGLALAGLFLKPTLAAPILVALVLAAEGAMLGGMVLGGALILALSLLGGGLDAWLAYANKLAHPDKLMASFWIYWTRQMTLRSLLPKLAPDKDTAYAFGWATMTIAAGILAWIAALGWRIRRSAAGLEREFAFAATLSAALLAAPHLLEYDLGLYLPGMVASAAWILTGRAHWPRAGAVCLLAAWTAGWMPKLNMVVLLNVSVVELTAWVVWMLCELRHLHSQHDQLKNRTLQDGAGHAEVDHQARHVHEGGDHRR